MKFKKAGKFIIKKLSKELPRHLSYHSVEHIQDVYNSAEKIGIDECISVADMKLLLTAAWYHDSGFLKGAKDHEEESCRIAREALPMFDYSEAEIDKICGMIMATKIPQSPKTHLEEILADADLDYLGRDDFFTIGDKLYNELCVFGFLDNENDWNKLQVKFLENHNYFTKSAIALRQEKKHQHLQQVKSKIS
ncbi:HD domain-containing protein [Mucilaginibacter ginkgonis]|uniref:Uncharacterized protein n=1 Tax=Mucilaginibacter ginkgonis TaxID=2682091 RepID=A0A6I4HZS0_9SPHI|nr:phosphohydrolase [Mucilaginibacter ginkgonis]QQL49923.1 hypothetical protein GO620_000280 [Mucilaginibacter ginkgonis]